MRHDLVDLGKVAQVGEVDVELGGMVEAAASGLGDLAQVEEHLVDLRFDALDQDHGLCIQPDLAGQVNGVTHFHTLGIGADGGGGIGGGEDLFGHKFSFSYSYYVNQPNYVATAQPVFNQLRLIIFSFFTLNCMLPAIVSKQSSR